MANRTRSGGADATVEEGASALGNAFHQVAQGLTFLQDALRLHEQEAERSLQEALRLQEERAAAALREAVRQREQKLQEKDDAIRALQQRLQEVEERLTAVEQGAMSSEVDGKVTALPLLECRVQKVEASLERAVDKFFPRVEALLRQLESSPTKSSRASTTASAAGETGGGAADTTEVPSPPGPPRAAFSVPHARGTTTACGAASGARGETCSPGLVRASTSCARGVTATEEETVADLEKEREVQRVELRVREAKERRDRGNFFRWPLGRELCVAVKMKNINEVRRLLDSGADVNFTDALGFTPLVSACSCKSNEEIVSLLLERDADANTVSANGHTALHVASRTNAHCVPLLIAAGADVDARNLKGATPLHRAVKWDNGTAARALLAAGARTDLKGWDGVYKDKAPFDVATSTALQDLLRLWL